MHLSVVLLCAFGLFLQNGSCTEEKQTRNFMAQMKGVRSFDQQQTDDAPHNLIAESSFANPKDKILLSETINAEDIIKRDSVEPPMNVHSPHRKQKRDTPRWNFSNISGSVSNIVIDGIDVTKVNNISCTDAYSRSVTGLRFENISEDLHDCYIIADGKKINLGGVSFKNVKGNIDNVHIITNNDGNSRENHPQKPDSSTRPQGLIHIITALLLIPFLYRATC